MSKNGAARGGQHRAQGGGKPTRMYAPEANIADGAHGPLPPVSGRRSQNISLRKALLPPPSSTPL